MASSAADAAVASPSCIHDFRGTDVNDNTFVDGYLYLTCIRYIKHLKKNVPFYESSPMLNDISQLASWTKLAAGLFKLYKGEVLGKRQVVQHWQFGRMFSADWTPTLPTATMPLGATLFRTAATPAAGLMPPTKAPWVATPSPGLMPPTKAPWAS